MQRKALISLRKKRVLEEDLQKKAKTFELNKQIIEDAPSLHC